MVEEVKLTEEEVSKIQAIGEKLQGLATKLIEKPSQDALMEVPYHLDRLGEQLLLIESEVGEIKVGLRKNPTNQRSQQ